MTTLSAEKKCSRCKTIKYISDFYQYKNGYYRSYCKKCHSLREFERLQNPVSANQKREYSRLYSAAHSKLPETKEYKRNWYLNNKYQLTNLEYQLMLEAQNHQCLICASSENLIIDHNHETGKVRGILCDSCNVGISRLRENPDFLRKAASYLEDN